MSQQGSWKKGAATDAFVAKVLLTIVAGAGLSWLLRLRGGWVVGAFVLAAIAVNVFWHWPPPDDSEKS